MRSVRSGEPIVIEITTVEGDEKVTFEPQHFSIDDTEIDRELCQMGRLMLAYGELESNLRVQLERMEGGLQRLEAELDTKIRAEAKQSEERTTEGRIQAIIRQDSSRLELISRILTVRRSFETTRWATRALQAKRDCLIALAYRDREVLKADRAGR